jgi:UDP:flavonoid glycosyltransferase YjiC (YdhE family)
MLLKPRDISNKTVLLAALDWGMGHTTRCVSIIRALLKQGNELIFAGDDNQIHFIRKEFPGIKTEKLEGYKILLDSNKNTYLQMARQQKSMLKAIKNENSWLKNYIQANKVDVVISDNRYGFYHNEIPSVIITHQLNLQLPTFRLITNWIVKRLIEKFNAVWVPDDAQRTLTGELSNQKLNTPIHFVGLLNRFEQVKAEKKYDYLVILSGPEPERTNFLEYAEEEMLNLGVTAAFVGAQVDGFDSFFYPTTTELGTLIAQSDCVFSRAGYTTIMEMIGLNQKAELFPTKGQYEQEYLAKHIKHPQLTFFNEWDSKRVRIFTKS